MAVDDGSLRVGNLIYAGGMTSVCFSDRFLTTLSSETGIPTVKRMRPVRLNSAVELNAYPFVIMNGQKSFTLLAKERTLLKKYLHNGGFLLASAGCSSEKWSGSLRTELQGIFGADCLKPIPANHAIFKTLFSITKTPLKNGGNARFEGVTIDGRLVCLFSAEGLNDTAHTRGCCCCGGNEVKNAEKIVSNILMYALLE